MLYVLLFTESLTLTSCDEAAGRGERRREGERRGGVGVFEEDGKLFTGESERRGGEGVFEEEGSSWFDWERGDLRRFWNEVLAEAAP